MKWAEEINYINGKKAFGHWEFVLTDEPGGYRLTFRDRYIPIRAAKDMQTRRDRVRVAEVMMLRHYER